MTATTGNQRNFWSNIEVSVNKPLYSPEIEVVVRRDTILFGPERSLLISAGVSERPNKLTLDARKVAAQIVKGLWINSFSKGSPAPAILVRLRTEHLPRGPQSDLLESLGVDKEEILKSRSFDLLLSGGAIAVLSTLDWVVGITVPEK